MLYILFPCRKIEGQAKDTSGSSTENTGNNTKRGKLIRSEDEQHLHPLNWIKCIRPRDYQSPSELTAVGVDCIKLGFQKLFQTESSNQGPAYNKNNHHVINND